MRGPTLNGPVFSSTSKCLFFHLREKSLFFHLKMSSSKCLFFHLKMSFEVAFVLRSTSCIFSSTSCVFSSTLYVFSCSCGRLTERNAGCLSVSLCLLGSESEGRAIAHAFQLHQKAIAYLLFTCIKVCILHYLFICTPRC